MSQEYHLIDDPSVKRKYSSNKFIHCIQKRKNKIIIGLLFIFAILGVNLYHNFHSDDTPKKTTHSPDTELENIDYYNITENKDLGLLFLKGKPRIDPYGVDLNVHILDGIYTAGFNGDLHASVEDWDLYTPPCPYLHPVKYPESILHPHCEGSSLQISNYDKNSGKDLPYSLRLDSITNQMEKWEDWKKYNGTNPKYGERRVSELLGDEYHPFDYGYTGKDTTNAIGDNDFYSGVIRSRMDEVPDPRRRRLFSFIMFNGEFDLLDLYLAEYYEVIDYFVIYESNSTFSGHPKPLYFTRTLFETDRYNRFKDKLIPLPCEIIVDEDNGRGKGFPKEHLARRTVIEKGLRAVHARHGDLFMHGDLDEMPKVHILSRMKKCGGWEHLQAGIGGGPKSFKDPDTKSYFIDKAMNVNMTDFGEYKVDYERHLSVGFLAWFYEYSFNIIQNKSVGTVAHPNIAIFDARRSLGQLVDYTNKAPEFKFYEGKTAKKVVKTNKTTVSNTKSDKANVNKTNANKANSNKAKSNKNNSSKTKSKRSEGAQEHYDPILDPNFDVYQGYTYTDNTNDRKIGKGYLGEYARFVSSDLNIAVKEEKPIIWNSGWHLSSFLPTIHHFYNKISSYSHFNVYEKKSKEEIEEDIITRIKGHFYIYGKKRKYASNEIYFPPTYEGGYEYHTDYNYWEENTRPNHTPKKSFTTYVDNIKRDIPTQVWKNPICYNFMIDRDHGLDKKLWWEVVPKEEWKTVRFETLDDSLLKEIIPKNLPENLKDPMLKELAKQ